MNSTPTVSALLFDLDGVLVQSMHVHHRAYEVALAEWCPVPPLSTVAGRRTEDVVVECLAPFTRDHVTITSVVQRKREVAARLLDALGPELITPGAVELLREVRERELPVGICTSGSRESIDRFVTLSKLGPSHFSCLLAAPDVLHAKPHPEIYQRGCEILHVAPRGCLVVEDSVSGLNAGLAAGCQVVAYRRDSEQIDLPEAVRGAVDELLAVLRFL